MSIALICGELALITASKSKNLLKETIFVKVILLKHYILFLDTTPDISMKIWCSRDKENLI